MELKPSREIDLRGKECPFTLLEIGDALRGLETGALLKVTTDHDSIVEDVKAWCAGTGTEFVEVRRQGGIHIYLRKA